MEYIKLSELKEIHDLSIQYIKKYLNSQFRFIQINNSFEILADKMFKDTSNILTQRIGFICTIDGTVVYTVPLSIYFREVDNMVFKNIIDTIEISFVLTEYILQGNCISDQGFVYAMTRSDYNSLEAFYVSFPNVETLKKYVDRSEGV